MKDLHIHTKYSDGEYDEFEILKKIENAGVTEFAICDHDTLEGSKRVFNVLKNQNSNLIFHSGVELTSRVNNIFGGVNVHLLVRDFNFDDEWINLLITEISFLRAKKIQRMVDFIAETYDIKFTKEEIDNVVKNTKSVGKPHMYKLLRKYGNFDRDEYYRNMDFLNSDDLRLDAIKVLSLALGRASVTLAHPKEIMREHHLGYTEIDNLVAYLKVFGLTGIEVMHSSHTKKDIAEFSKIAKKYGLEEPLGSDYHGENVKPDVHLGVCSSDN